MCVVFMKMASENQCLRRALNLNNTLILYFGDAGSQRDRPPSQIVLEGRT